MTIDWGKKAGFAIAFNVSGVNELQGYHPKADGYHFVKMKEDNGTFTMKAINRSVYDTSVPDSGYGWSPKAKNIIESLELHREVANPDVLVGKPNKRIYEAGWALMHWRIESHPVFLPSGTRIVVATDTLTWQRQDDNGLPSDLNGVLLPEGQNPIEVTTSWDWEVID